MEKRAIELTQRFGVEVLFRACDLETLPCPGSCWSLKKANGEIGGLLVNCAGIGTSGPFLAQDWMTEQDLIEVNILALTRMRHALGNAMVAWRQAILNTVASAVSAFQPGPWMSSYYASKAYVLHVSLTCAKG